LKHFTDTDIITLILMGDPPLGSVARLPLR